MNCLYNTQESLLTGLLTTMCQKQGRVWLALWETCCLMSVLPLYENYTPVCFSFTIHTKHFTSDTSAHQTGGSFSPWQASLCNTSWVSYNVIQLWHYLPGDSIKSHRLRVQFDPQNCHPPLQMPISSHRLSPVLLIHCLWSGGFHDHLFGLDTSLNCLTELRETLRWLVTQGYDEDTHDYSEGRGAEHRVWRQWCRTYVSSPEARCPPWASAESTIQKLIKPHALRIYIEASTHRHDQSLTQSLAPLPFLNEASNHGLYFLMTSPHPGVKQSHSESPQ